MDLATVLVGQVSGQGHVDVVSRLVCRAFTLTQEICSAWQDKVSHGVDVLWAQHKSQAHRCRLLCEAVQQQCTMHAGFSSDKLAGMFNTNCLERLEVVEEQEKCRIQRICGQLEAECQKWCQLVINCWHGLTSKCATTLHAYEREIQSVFAAANATLSDLNRKRQQEKQCYEQKYQDVVDRILCACTEDELETLQAAASQQLDTTKQAYHSGYHLVLDFLTVQESKLQDMHENHITRICNVLGIFRESKLNDVDTSLATITPEDGRSCSAVQQLSSQGANDSDCDAVCASRMKACQCDDEPATYLICGTRYISKQNLVAMLLPVPATDNANAALDVADEAVLTTGNTDIHGASADASPADNWITCPDAPETVQCPKEQVGRSLSPRGAVVCMSLFDPAVSVLSFCPQRYVLTSLVAGHPTQHPD